jgi:DNA polymerase
MCSVWLPWLDAEIGLIQPKILVCLGATAVQALIDTDFHITRQRGQPHRGAMRRSPPITHPPFCVLRIRPGNNKPGPSWCRI